MKYSIILFAGLAFIGCSVMNGKEETVVDSKIDSTPGKEYSLFSQIDSVNLILEKCNSDTLTDMGVSSEGGEIIIYSLFSSPVHMRMTVYGEMGQRTTTFLNFKENKIRGFDQFYTYDLPVYEEQSKIVDSLIRSFEIIDSKIVSANCEWFINGDRQEKCVVDNDVKDELLSIYNDSQIKIQEQR